MDVKREEKNREEFRNILFDLSELDFSLKDPASRSKMYQRLEQLYYAPRGSEKYRHFYSDIFIVLTQIHQKDHPGSIDILGQNLLEIRKGYQPLNIDENNDVIDIQDELKKLYDHVSLDIARISYSDWADLKVGQQEGITQVKNEIAIAKNDIEIAKNEIDQAKADLHEQVEIVKREVNDTQKEHIAILGIFASIVLAFTGGLSFSTSVLENMHLVSVYRAVIISLIIGLVLINILGIMFHYISRLVNKEKKKGFWLLIIANITFLTLIVFTILAWCGGVVEKRNTKIDQAAAHIASTSQLPMQETEYIIVSSQEN